MTSAAPADRHNDAVAASAASESHSSHRLEELASGVGGRRQAGFLDRAQGPVPFLAVGLLRRFERVQGPQHGQEPFVDRGRLSHQVRRVDHQDRVELEPHGAGLDVANAGQEQARHQLAIGQAVAQVAHGHVKDLVARGLLDPTDRRLDLGAELDEIGGEEHLRAAGRGEIGGGFEGPAPRPGRGLRPIGGSRVLAASDPCEVPPDRGGRAETRPGGEETPGADLCIIAPTDGCCLGPQGSGGVLAGQFDLARLCVVGAVR